MNNDFRQSIAALNQAATDFANGHTTGVAYASARAAALVAAIQALAGTFGVTLAPIAGIDAQGELSIFVQNASFGQFGRPFACLLNSANPRTGNKPDATLDSLSGRCYMHHYDVEKLVLRYAKEHS